MATADRLDARSSLTCSHDLDVDDQRPWPRCSGPFRSRSWNLFAPFEVWPASRALRMMTLVDYRTLQRAHLAAAERHVSQGAALIARQKSLVTKLEVDGRDATKSRALLKAFMEAQAVHEKHLETLRAALVEPPAFAIIGAARMKGTRR